ncbi:MAG: hypothetical protein A2293_02475 [Elusimicrobia bacterium RIFOXYB2_FULL_49_7]|nr:MAG: hypothetical protein A2293_02475 [Elusimicrobia bacterium RIFOXYB2_FULL_49_7]
MIALRIAFFLIFLAGVNPVWAKVRLCVLSHIPTADLLSNNQIALRLNDNLFVYSTSDTGDVPTFWYMPTVDGAIGIFDRVEAGVGYAGGVSVQFKGLVLEEDRIPYVPSVTVGAKDVMWSSEAYYFGLEEEKTRDALSNNVYLALAKTFEPYGLRLHAGSMTNFKLADERFSPFAGLELYVGGGTYLGYETFSRFNVFHHFFNISYMHHKRFIFSIGLSELTNAFRKDGKSGFYLFNREGLATNGYGAPGITFSLTLAGSLLRSADGLKGTIDELRELREEMAGLRAKQTEMETRIENAENATLDIEEDIALYVSHASADMKKNYQQAISDNLNALKNLAESPGQYDPEQASVHVKRIVEYKELALPFLGNILKKPGTHPKFMSLCIQMVGQIGNKKSRSMLLKLLDVRESAIKIDAIIALGNLNDKSVVPDLERSMYDTDDAVIMAAREVITRLTGIKPILKEKPDQPVPTEPETDDATQTEPAVEAETPASDSLPSDTTQSPVLPAPADSNSTR